MEKPSEDDLMRAALTCDILADFLKDGNFYLEDIIYHLRNVSDFIISTQQLWGGNKNGESPTTEN